MPQVRVILREGPTVASANLAESLDVVPETARASMIPHDARDPGSVSFFV
jgi:hypothetical protein